MSAIVHITDKFRYEGKENLFATGVSNLKGQNKKEMNKAAKAMAEAYFV